MGPTRKGFPREPHEHYVEEMWVSRRLFETHDFGPLIVDPCAGFGSIPMMAMGMGLDAWGADLVSRAPWIAGGRDFLSSSWRAPARFRKAAFVFNPPFGGRKPTIQAFAQKAIKHAAKVAMLIPCKRLSAAGMWLEALPLVEVCHVSPRSSLWPGRLHAEHLKAGRRLQNGFDDAVWLIFDKTAPPGAPKTSWLRREA